MTRGLRVLRSRPDFFRCPVVVQTPQCSWCFRREPIVRMAIIRQVLEQCCSRFMRLMVTCEVNIGNLCRFVMVSMVLGVLQDGRAQPFYEMTDLAELGIVSANCLNNRGVVAGVNREADELILVERGRVVARAAWPGGQISPHAINDRNDVVGNVFFASKPAQSFRFTGGQFTEIPALPGHELSYPVG